MPTHITIDDEDEKSSAKPKPKPKPKSFAERRFGRERPKPVGLGTERIVPRPGERKAPSIEAMKEYPDVLEGAIRRGQVKMIARHAPPGQKDTSDVFTAEGKRYAKTGSYAPTVGERLSALQRGAGERSGQWWNRNKKTIIIGAFSATAALLMFNAWRNAQQKNRAARQRGQLAQAHASAAVQHAQLAQAAAQRVGWGPHDEYQYSGYDMSGFYGLGPRW